MRVSEGMRHGVTNANRARKDAGKAFDVGAEHGYGKMARASSRDIKLSQHRQRYQAKLARQDVRFE